MPDASLPPVRLPKVARWGPLWNYAQYMAPTTEAPVEFHFGAVATCLSPLFGRAYVQLGPRRLHTNLQSVLVGATGTSRKTTAVGAAVDAAKQVSSDLLVLYGVGSREGLITSLPDDGGPVILRVAEFTGLLKKAQSKATGGLTELLMELYDRPVAIENRLAQDKITRPNPNLALLSDSTPDHLADTFAESGLENGFLNRLSLWTGEPSGPKPFPPPPDELLLTAWASEVAEAVTRCQTTSHPAPTVTDSARDWWDTVYREDLYPRLHRGADGSPIARSADKAWQFALLYTVLAQESRIEADHIETGWAVARYLADTSLDLARNIGLNSRHRAQQVLLDTVNRWHTEKGASKGISIREITQRLSKQQRTLVAHYGGASRLLPALEDEDELISGDSGKVWWSAEPPQPKKEEPS